LAIFFTTFFRFAFALCAALALAASLAASPGAASLALSAASLAPPAPAARHYIIATSACNCTTRTTFTPRCITAAIGL